MNHKEIAKQLFIETKKHIPKAFDIAISVIENAIGSNSQPVDIKHDFSRLVEELQISAYNEYLECESYAAGMALKKIVLPMIGASATAEGAIDFLSDNFMILDKFYLSLTQSRRTRAGSTFETIVSNLFSRLSYPYTPQPDIGGSTPDYVLPSLEWYSQYPSDCIVLTLKRSLRERWRQIVTEGNAGKFYLATIDEKISQPGLKNMLESNITLVVPASIKENRYALNHNVITFEGFFEYHLEPAILKWNASGAA